MLGQANNGQNRLSFRLRTSALTTTLTAATGTLPLNTWYHAAATYDGINMRLYLNGVQVASVAKSGSLAPCLDVPLHIGRSPEGSNYLRGAIDDVRIYSSALNATEIKALMAPSNQPPTVSLISPGTAPRIRLAPLSRSRQWRAMLAGPSRRLRSMRVRR